jgi:hypothetical protein
VVNERPPQQHIKKNYCGNMNVCVGMLKECHSEEKGSIKCWMQEEWQGVNQK